MADTTPEVSNALVRLMSGTIDYDTLSDEDLFALGRAARRGRLTLHEVVLKLQSRGYKLAAIGEELGGTESAASRWAQPPKPPGRRRLNAAGEDMSRDDEQPDGGAQ